MKLSWDSNAVQALLVDSVAVSPNALFNSTFRFANVAVTPGVHTVTTMPAGQPVGLEIYGYQAGSSYASTGPQRFENIAPNLMVP